MLTSALVSLIVLNMQANASVFQGPLQVSKNKITFDGLMSGIRENGKVRFTFSPDFEAYNDNSKINDVSLEVMRFPEKEVASQKMGEMILLTSINSESQMVFYKERLFNPPAGRITDVDSVKRVGELCHSDANYNLTGGCFVVFYDATKNGTAEKKWLIQDENGNHVADLRINRKAYEFKLNNNLNQHSENLGFITTVCGFLAMPLQNQNRIISTTLGASSLAVFYLLWKNFNKQGIETGSLEEASGNVMTLATSSTSEDPLQGDLIKAVAKKKGAEAKKITAENKLRQALKSNVSSDINKASKAVASNMAASDAAKRAAVKAETKARRQAGKK
jgi:hypothetical protein